MYECSQTLSRVQLFVTHILQPADSSVHGILQQEYWSGLLCSPPGGLSDPGIKTASLRSPALAGRFFITRATWEAHMNVEIYHLSTFTNVSMGLPWWLRQ